MQPEEVHLGDGRRALPRHLARHLPPHPAETLYIAPHEQLGDEERERLTIFAHRDGTEQPRRRRAEQPLRHAPERGRAIDPVGPQSPHRDLLARPGVSAREDVGRFTARRVGLREIAPLEQVGGWSRGTITHGHATTRS